MRATTTALLVWALLVGLPQFAAAECPGRDDPIETDRPDVTNSSLVVPRGSVQVENGVNWTVHQPGQIFDGPETRVRVGAFRCGELLVDVPNYIRSTGGSSSSELSALVLSAKRQLFIESPSFSLSVTAGLGVSGIGIGAADREYTPYIQLPWSRSITDDWSVNGMVTVTWSTAAKTSYEPTFVLERAVGRRGDLFAEYIGDYTSQATASQILDVGGGWHITSKQMLDFHIGVGLTRNSPRRYVGVGYSLRIDGLFASP